MKAVLAAQASTPHKVLHWQVGAGKAPQWAVRQGDWKLIGNVEDPTTSSLSAEDKKLFLVNLATDVAETRNRAKEHPDVVQRLLKVHQEWAAAQKNPASKGTYQDKAGNER